MTIQSPKNISQAISKFEIFRNGFSAFEHGTYMSICYRAILHNEVRGAVNTFLDHLALPFTTRVDHEDVVANSRVKFAKLINADSSFVSVSRSVSDGINTLAWAFPLQEGDNVVISIDHEHPNNIYPWLRLQKKGIQVREVALNTNGSLNIEAMIEQIDADTKIMTCSSVSYAPGHRADLEQLGAACRKNDVFFLVDGVQSAGILKHDMQSEPIDGFVTSTAKGLLGLYGYGFIYVSPNWIDRLEPAYLSRAGINIDMHAHSVMSKHDYQMWPDSRRFEVGSFNYAGAYAADKALDLLLELGSEDIGAYVLQLRGQLYDGAIELGLKTPLERDGDRRSGILTFGDTSFSKHNDDVDPMINRISEHLNEANIIHTIRDGQIRFGLHAYNNESDVLNTLQCMKDALA